MRTEINSICLFCGSSLGKNGKYATAAARLGGLLARKNIQMVYGGAEVGLMGSAANACLARGGRVVGVMPQSLLQLEVGHKNLTKLVVVETMHERKREMHRLSDAFIALPGGVGTLEETFEVFTWLQLGYHLKPIGLLNTEGYYDPLMTFLEGMANQDFVRAEHLDMLLKDKDPDRLLDRVLSATPKKIDKWFDRVGNLA